MKFAVIGLIVLLIAVPAGLYFTGVIQIGSPAAAAEGGAEDEHGEVATDSHGNPIPDGADPVYLTLDPPFIVNFVHRGTLRYLQISLELMYHNEALLAKVTTRMPEIRNDLILLFSNQEYEKLSTMEGKEELRHEIIAAINHVLGVKEDSKDADGEVFITNFVMQ